MPQFGQPPLAALLPLKAGQNLADLPDKAAALINLGTLSSSDIMMNAVPIGTIIAFWGATAPTGYLPCNGQTVNSGTFPDLVTFLGGGSSQALPDLRGEFLRGWDNGRGVDIGRAIKTLQLDDFESHSHSLNGSINFTYTSNPTADFKYFSTGPSTSNTSSTGGIETRPRNVAVQYCMKAYGALVNTATANIGNVLTELSQMVNLNQFGSSKATAGYQKLPSGLVIQWTPITTSVFSNGFNTVNLPIAFPTAGLLSVASGANSTVGYFGCEILGTSQLRFTNSYTAAQSGFAIAIGY